MEDERRTADEHAEEPLREEDLARDEEERRAHPEADGEATRHTERVSVVNEPQRSDDDEFRWHTGLNRPTSAADAVEFVDVHKAFGRNKILRGLNMGIPEGKISMILGPSGTGKSVFLKNIMGLLKPERGEIWIDGKDIVKLGSRDLYKVRRKFGVLFQDGALFGSMNVFDNVAFPLREHTRKPEREIKQIVDEKLGLVGLQGAEKKLPGEISGGMKKRAGLARALAHAA